MSKKIILPLLTVCQTVSVYLLIIIPVEYCLTEKFLIIPSISPNVKTIIFILTLLIVFSVNFFINNFYETSLDMWLVWPILFISMLFFNYAYTPYYKRIIQEPRIYSISSDWAIQAKKIEIHGRGFGEEPFRSGVKINDYNLEIITWTPNFIEVEVPVLPEFFEGQLYIEKADGTRSNAVPLSIRDPAFLEELYNDDQNL